MTYIGDRNDSVNKAIFILHSLCIFGAQMTIITAGLVYRLNQRHLSSFGRYTGCLPLTYNTRYYINGIDTLYIAQNSSSAFGLNIILVLYTRYHSLKY